MLIQFAVENFRSFRDKAVLSMRAGEAAALGESRLFANAGPERVSRVAVIYGANASGKSNLVEAIALARYLIVESISPNEPLPYYPFKLDPSYRDQPSRFEFVFFHKNALYSYGFLIDSRRIHAEWLHRGSDQDEELLFQRELDTASERYEFEIGEALISYDPAPNRRQFYEFLHEGTRPNQLFLNAAWQRFALHDVLEWFHEFLRIVLPDTNDLSLTRRVQSAGGRELVSKLLRDADTGIQEVFVKQSQSPFRATSSAWDHLSEEAVRQKLTMLLGGRHGGMFSASGDDEQRVFENPQGELEVAHLRLVTRHSGSLEPVEFELSEESEGTRRFMHLAPMLLGQVPGPEKTVVIDEIERSLHPLLTVFLMREFLGEAGGNDQLICTTHEDNLLDVELLAPEAIWFVEKDRQGGSHLYSLDEFDENQLKALRHHKRTGYLAGRFGAIPFLGDARRLLPREDEPAPADNEHP